MQSSGYITLTRQAGLGREMDAVANNIANISTTGFRRESVIFSEYVAALGPEASSVSMAAARGRQTHLMQGELTGTGGAFDFAIEGEGFFRIETPQGDRLTRAGSFSPNEAGELATTRGHRLLDIGGAPVFVPPQARDISLAPDGTLAADGQPIALLGLFEPADGAGMQREGGTMFRVDGDIVPVAEPTIKQGFLEGSNVDPVAEIARMIEVQRAYELGQSFLDREDERIRSAIDTLGR
ncbi:flagellar basal-body rod protein FlgF [Rhodobacteraceae bacterium WD3A24]|nr:flagellar basal-body rod protein FlgF [Rhodobacteraceae bacterium WD3A24]